MVNYKNEESIVCQVEAQKEFEVINSNYGNNLSEYEKLIGQLSNIVLRIKYVSPTPIKDCQEPKSITCHIDALHLQNEAFCRMNVELSELVTTLNKIF